MIDRLRDRSHRGESITKMLVVSYAIAFCWQRVKHDQSIGQHRASMATLAEAIQAIRNANVSIHATIDRLDRLFDCLINRDQGQSG